MKKKNILGGGYLRKLRYPIILILVVGASFLMLHNSNKETILKEEIQENTLSIYLEDEQINYIPEKDSGYTLDTEKSSCTNGVTLDFDTSTWSVKVNYSNYTNTNTDNTRVRCSLHFKKGTFVDSVVSCGNSNKDAGTCIKENVSLSDEIIEDGTVDNNLRFIGANPSNYVWFNDELWRIIGVMNNIEDSTGKKETRLKIIRNESIGDYSWDNKPEGTGSSSSIYGSNDWSDSALQQVLNSGAYWNRTSGTCPYGINGTTTACDFSDVGLTESAKAMMGDAVWNLGSGDELDSPIEIYRAERGTDVYTGHATKWSGKVALMYPSDYGYATGGGATGRSACLSYRLDRWDTYSDCYQDNWLYNNRSKWTLTPSSSFEHYVLHIYLYGSVDNTYPYSPRYSIYPSVYLLASIKITGGDGSAENPYILAL